MLSGRGMKRYSIISLNILKETSEMVLDGTETSSRFGNNIVESVKTEFFLKQLSFLPI